jgi:hypothetical protein
MTPSINDTQHNNTAIMLSVIMLSFAFFVVMLSVVAPLKLEMLHLNAPMVSRKDVIILVIPFFEQNPSQWLNQHDNMQC